MAAKRTIADIDAELTAPGSPFEIDLLDIRGVPTKVWRQAPRTLVDILAGSRAHGREVFIVHEDRRITFNDHATAAATLATAFRLRLGLRPGARVAIAMRNLPEWSTAFWAVAAAGGIVVSLNAWWTGEELAYALSDSGASVVVADVERAERIEGAVSAGGLPELRHVVVVGGGGGTVGWEDLLAGLEPVTEVPGPVCGPDDEATIFYTSGTTGRPKGVLGTHRNICSNPVSSRFVAARAAMRRGEEPAAAGQGPRNVYLLSVPLFHATGCHSLLVGNLSAGGTMVMMSRWDPGRALELIERERVTSFGGVPTMALQVLDHPDLARRDTSSVTSVRFGGAPAPPDLVRRLRDAFGSSPAMNGYGMTETSALATMNVGQDYLDRPDSVGVPVPVVTMQVVGADATPLPAGDVGELWVRGPNVVQGYWQDPEATAVTFVDGWVRTGDLARIDGEGFVYVVDRAKDLVIRGGENIASVEVEGVLYEHPAVAEAAVIGVPHPTLGEEVGAVVTLLPGLVATDGELREFAATRLARFKVPTRWWLRRTELPRNPAGKVVKAALRQEVLGTPAE